MRYAIVVSRGRYGQGDIVRGRRCHLSLAGCRARAERMTAQHQKAMAPYGGTSGGFRVVELYDGQREPVWQGLDLDQTPDAG